MEDGAATRIEVLTALYILWELADGSLGSGKLTSLSRAGCFVQTKTEVEVAVGISLRLRLPTERWLLLRGSVRQVRRRVGFDVQFAELTEADREMLRLLMEYYSEDRTVLTAEVCEP